MGDWRAATSRDFKLRANRAVVVSNLTLEETVRIRISGSQSIEPARKQSTWGGILEMACESQ